MHLSVCSRLCYLHGPARFALVASGHPGQHMPWSASSLAVERCYGMLALLWYSLALMLAISVLLKQTPQPDHHPRNRVTPPPPTP